ncbi:MAG: hypothetical protein ABJD11_00110 [Gemmatimonadota bacterium]
MRTTILLLGAIAAFPAVASAQAVEGGQSSGITGIQVRRYSFESGSPNAWVRQVAIPFAVMVPIGKRLSVDVGTHYASTTVRSSAGSEESLNGLTDTQLRGSYIFGNDALVATLLVNLPTGQEKTSFTKFNNVAGQIASNFLLFPVNSYGSGTSATGGLAAATQFGNWNVGAAGSVRVNASYQPFSDAAQASLRYKPGVEGRIRLGADRLVGSSRLEAGVTLSTFSNDEFTGAAASTGSYNPGTRYIGELGLTSPYKSGSVSLYLWDFYRSNAKDTSTVTVSNRENIFTAGASANFPLSPAVGLRPLIEGRFWSGAGRSGQLYGGGASLPIGVSPRFQFTPGARYDFGHLETPAVTGSKSIKGWELSGLLRYSF